MPAIPSVPGMRRDSLTWPPPRGESESPDKASEREPVSGFEPLTCRLQGGFASPRRSTTGHLSRSYALLAAPGVHACHHVSTTVVSAALAVETGPDCLTFRSAGGKSKPTRSFSMAVHAWVAVLRCPRALILVSWLPVAFFAWRKIFEKLAERCETRRCIKVGLFSKAVQLLLDVLESRLNQPSHLLAQKLCAGYYPRHEA